MSRVTDIVGAFGRGLSALFRTTKDAYEGASRFQRLRVLCLGVFAVDLIAVLVFVIGFGARPMDLEVWFEPMFPANMLVIRNEGDRALTAVELELDDRYRLEVGRLPPGLNGFEVNRAFRDASGRVPGEDYRPSRVVVRADEGEVEIPVETRQEP